MSSVAKSNALVTRAATDVAIPLYTFEQLERMAQSFAKSGLFGVKTPDQALALMLISQAEGRHPALAAQDYHIIQNRPSLKADTILARFQQCGGSVKWNCYTDKCVSGTFSHPQGSDVTVEWTIERAQNVKVWNDTKKQFAPLTDKDNWQNYPRSMLRSRTVSEGVRACYPRATNGVYTPEELQDGTVEIDVTPLSQDAAVKTVVGSATALTPDECNEHLKAIAEATDQDTLAHAFAASWTHAGQARDSAAREKFKDAYDERKAKLGEPKEETAQ